MIINQRGISTLGILILIVVGAIGMMLFLSSNNSKDTVSDPSTENPAEYHGVTAETDRAQSHKNPGNEDPPKSEKMQPGETLLSKPGTKNSSSQDSLKKPFTAKTNTAEQSPSGLADSSALLASLDDTSTVLNNETEGALSLRGFSDSIGPESTDKKVLSQNEIRVIYNKRVEIMQMLD